MQKAAFEAEVSAGVETMIDQQGDRATDQARADLLRALDDGAPEVAVAYEICLRLIERQSRYRASATASIATGSGKFGWLRSWFAPAKPIGASLAGRPAL